MNNCFIIKTLCYHLSNALIDSIYKFYTEKWDFSEYLFTDYLFYLFVFYVENIEDFYTNLPDLSLYEENDLMEALSELYY